MKEMKRIGPTTLLEINDSVFNAGCIPCVVAVVFVCQYGSAEDCECDVVELAVDDLLIGAGARDRNGGVTCIVAVEVMTGEIDILRRCK